VVSSRVVMESNVYPMGVSRQVPPGGIHVTELPPAATLHPVRRCGTGKQPRVSGGNPPSGYPGIKKLRSALLGDTHSGAAFGQFPYPSFRLDRPA
jgi:hypothetical protein